jgi:glucose/mannose-6-phosphate isomerase
MNENANQWAFSQSLPELNHNSVVAYQQQPEKDNEWFVLFLRSPLLHQRILLRYQATYELLAKYAISHKIIDIEGDEPFDQLIAGILYGDWVSYYLAILHGVDPTPVKPIEYLKKRLLEL